NLAGSLSISQGAGFSFGGPLPPLPLVRVGLPVGDEIVGRIETTVLAGKSCALALMVAAALLSACTKDKDAADSGALDDAGVSDGSVPPDGSAVRDSAAEADA